MSAGLSYERAVSRPAFGFRRRRRREGIFGPMMFRIASAELFAHLRIGVGPEAGQILRDLDWPLGRRQEMQDHGHRAVRDARGVLAAEHLLKPYREDWD